jgi:hypothetical protein
VVIATVNLPMLHGRPTDHDPWRSDDDGFDRGLLKLDHL